MCKVTLDSSLRAWPHLAEMLTRLIAPGTVCWSAIENEPRNAVSAMYQRLAGARSGMPHVIVLVWPTQTASPPIHG